MFSDQVAYFGLHITIIIIYYLYLLNFQIGSHVLAYSNSCINPFLYAFLSPPFKVDLHTKKERAKI